MAKALDIIVGNEFQSAMDDDEVKTTWLLRSLSSIEFMECTRNGFVDDEMFVRKGLTGWRDFPDGDGKEIEFNQDNIGRIPPMILQDISFEIQRISTLSEGERKNS